MCGLPLAVGGPSKKYRVLRLRAGARSLEDLIFLPKCEDFLFGAAQSSVARYFFIHVSLSLFW